MFNAEKVTKDIIQSIKDYFHNNGSPETKAIVGISGGKDSTIVAALCVQALGKDRVYGVLMPQGIQEDFNDAQAVVDFLEIDHRVVNIEPIVNAHYLATFGRTTDIPDLVKYNAPPKIRMCILFDIKNEIGGRVMNTSNLSEDYIGWFTENGDDRGNFAPLADLTVTEVKQVGKVLGVLDHLVEKLPIDGLCGQSDEEKFGFSYHILDCYIRGYEIFIDPAIVEKIQKMHHSAQFKVKPMSKFVYTG